MAFFELTVNSTPLKSPIPGLENFKGQLLHTGGWDESADCKDKNLAVIGNGSSGIQAFGALQKQAKQITHYIRSPTWISLNYMSQFTRNADGRNFECQSAQRSPDYRMLIAVQIRMRRKLPSKIRRNSLTTAAHWRVQATGSSRISCSMRRCRE